MNISTVTPEKNRRNNKKKKKKIVILPKNYDKGLNTIAALNNEVRINITNILAEELRSESGKYHTSEKYSLTAKQIEEKLIEYGIEKTTQGIGQHLKILTEYGIIGRIEGKINKYYLKMSAYDDVLMQIRFIQEQIQSYIDLPEKIHALEEKPNFVMMVLTGVDKSKLLPLKMGDVGTIGRNYCYKPGKYDSKTLLLSSFYDAIPELHKSKLKVFDKDGKWFFVDYSNCGSYISYKETSNKKLKQGVATEIPNKSFLQLSEGPGSVILYCLYTHPP